MTDETGKQMRHFEDITREDMRIVRAKELTYRGSWKKRGGAGAFMMLARKWDRIENIAEACGYDVFGKIQEQGLRAADGELLAEVQDLRRYLMQLEAEMIERIMNTRKEKEDTERQVANLYRPHYTSDPKNDVPEDVSAPKVRD